MAFLSAILSLLSKKVGDLVQALFGWSVTALFGRQSSAKQTALSVALALSVLWPLFVLGTFVPAAAAWALAFLPLERWLGATVLRVVWIALALTAPLIVGAITRWVAPARQTRGSALRTVLGGYPLTLGYASSFIVTALTVPVLKVATMARGWSEEHAYVQPRNDGYDATLRALAEAFVGADLTPEVGPVPGWMSIATRALKFFARGVVTPMVAENPQRVRAEGVEAYLYPADLVLRGDARKVAHVRAALMATRLDQHAYVVETKPAQKLQEQVQRIWEVLARHEREGTTPGAMLGTRVREIHDELRATDVSFEEWAMVERMIRRLEREVTGAPRIIDGAEQEREVARAEAANGRTMMDPAKIDDAPLSELLKEALGDVRELVKLEVELATDEAKKQAKEALRGAIAFGVALVMATVALALFAVALVLALGGTAPIAAAVGGGFALIAAGAAAYGYSSLPKNPMEETRARVRSDMQQIKENLA
ncbi:MAG: hypothetical protein JWM10_3534 [Myxococcaceae bacterium]|nr:hypothetical protein [Myxococcaceae bacterium]